MRMGTLKQISIILSFGVCLALAVGQNASAVNSVSIASMNVSPGETDVVVPIFLVNDIKLRGVTAPFLIRKIGPAYVDKVGLGYGGRMVGYLADLSFLRHFNSGQSDTAGCKRLFNTQPKSPGGYLKTPFTNQQGEEKQIVTSSPHGVGFDRNRLFGTVFYAPGMDVTASSLLMTLDIGAESGCFEIDTTCIDDNAHLLYVKDTLGAQVGAVPKFLQGVIHVGECLGTALASPAAASMSPGNGSGGNKTVTFSWDPAPEAAGYEVQIDTVDGTFANVWAQVTVQGTALTVTLPGDPQVDAEFFWRVRSVPRDCGFCLGPWTEPAQYTDVQTIASGGIPDSYILDQNYPNPFNASTVIEFTNKHDGNVKLEVFNILGQNVATLMEGFKPLGVYAVTWDGTDSRGNTVPSGMYFYRVSTDDFISVKKMTLLK